MKRKFNILQIIETGGPGGAETVVLNIVKNLDRKRFNPMVVLLRPGWLHRQLVENGIETAIIESAHSWDLRFLYRLSRFCKKHRVDLIHSHLCDINVYSCLVGRLTGIPVMTTYHGEIAGNKSIKSCDALKFYVVRHLAAKIVAVADYLRQDYIERAGFPAERTITVYNGITIPPNDHDSNKETKRKELGLRNDEMVVTLIANMRPPKGHSYFVEAAREIDKSLPKTRFLIVGDEDENIKQMMLIQIEKLRLNEKIVFLGFRPDATALLRITDVLVLSSISEGLPLAAVEAMAASKPVVATNVGGLHEVVVHGQSGFLVPPRDPVALAEKILLLLKDKGLRESMGRKGREIVERKFTVEKMIGNYQDLYEKLLS